MTSFLAHLLGSGTSGSSNFLWPIRPPPQGKVPRPVSSWLCFGKFSGILYRNWITQLRPVCSSDSLHAAHNNHRTVSHKVGSGAVLLFLGTLQSELSNFLKGSYLCVESVKLYLNGYAGDSVNKSRQYASILIQNFLKYYQIYLALYPICRENECNITHLIIFI